MSAEIRAAEQDMADRGCFAPAEAEGLRWNRYGDRFRILLNDKPLSDHKIMERAENLRHLESVKDAADAAMAKLAGDRS